MAHGSEIAYPVHGHNPFPRGSPVCSPASRDLAFLLRTRFIPDTGNGFPFLGQGSAVTIFWVVVALLLAGVLLMLLPPLWQARHSASPPTADGVNLSIYRDQLHEVERDLDAGLIAAEQMGHVRFDIQRRLLEDRPTPVTPVAPAAARRSAVALALLIPIGSVLSYLALGDQRALAPVTAPTVASADSRHSVAPDQIEKMVTALAERLRSEPDNAEGWMMLGRSYTALDRYADAVIAFRRASTLAPSNASLLADFADVLGMAQGKRLSGEPARLIQQALDADPRHVKALALAGSVSFESHDYAAARGYWERLIAVVPPDSDIARSVRGSISQALQLEGAASPAASATVATDAPSAAGTLSVSGEVAISQGLANDVAPGDTLFVFARAMQGPRMPLAIVKRPVGSWPSSFVLDDTMAMGPDLKLSRFGKVVVTARISRSGAASPQSGDLVGQSEPVAPGARGLRITVDRVQP